MKERKRPIVHSISFPMVVDEKIEAAMEKKSIGRSELVNRAITDYLERLDKEIDKIEKKEE